MDLSALAPLPPWAGQVQFDSEILLKKEPRQSLGELVSWASDDVKRVWDHTSYWLRHDFSAASEDTAEAREALGIVANALLSCQLAFPVGGESLMVIVQRTDGKFIPRMVVHSNPYYTTRAARMAFTYPIEAAKVLNNVLKGILFTFQKGPIRLINPLNFFRLGLQMSEVHVQVLLWTTALDALTMADNPSVFEKRLCNFLGSETYVYPDAPSLVRPDYRIKDLAGPLFELRSDIAHGREIKEKFWKSKTEIYGAEQEFRGILCDAALFLLCEFVQKIFRLGVIEEVGNSKQWKGMLQQKT